MLLVCTSIHSTGLRLQNLIFKIQVTHNSDNLAIIATWHEFGTEDVSSMSRGDGGEFVAVIRIRDAQLLVISTRQDSVTAVIPANRIHLSRDNTTNGSSDILYMYKKVDKDFENAEILKKNYHL